MSFKAIAGHHKAIKMLRKQIDNNRVPGGYLFVGPHGVGKLTAALSFASALNCASGGDDACNICRRIQGKNFPDVQIIDYDWQMNMEGKEEERKRKTLGIKTILKLQYYVSLKPMEGMWKIFIIDRAHTMTPEASNCFLKILEEPPDQTVFILIADNESQILPTIRSRCQLIRFGYLNKKDFNLIIKKNGITRPDMYSCMDGSPGRALETGLEGMEDLDHVMPLWEMIHNGKMLDVLTDAQREYNTNEEIKNLLNNLLLIAKQEFRNYEDHADRALSIICRALKRLNVNANAKLIRDVTLIQLARGGVCR